MEGVGPDFTPEDDLAVMVFNALVDGMGGVNWAGLPYFVDLYGIEDLDGLLERLVVIKTHTPTKDLT